MRLGGAQLLDPTNEEAAGADGSLLLAQMPSAAEVTQLTSSGAWASAEQRDALELALGGCAQLKAVMRDALLAAAAAAAPAT